jgi:hypothetical protein
LKIIRRSYREPKFIADLKARTTRALPGPWSLIPDP